MTAAWSAARLACASRSEAADDPGLPTGRSERRGTSAASSAALPLPFECLFDPLYGAVRGVLDLEPVLRLARRVGKVYALADNPFEAELAGVLEYFRAVAGQVSDEPHPDPHPGDRRAADHARGWPARLSANPARLPALA